MTKLAKVTGSPLVMYALAAYMTYQAYELITQARRLVGEANAARRDRRQESGGELADLEDYRPPDDGVMGHNGQAPPDGAVVDSMPAHVAEGESGPDAT